MMPLNRKRNQKLQLLKLEFKKVSSIINQLNQLNQGVNNQRKT